MEEKLNEVMRILKDHEKRILELEKFSKKSGIKGKVKGHIKKLNLETPIKTLYDKGFFSTRRKDTDIVQKLKEKVLTPSAKRSSVANVLRNFVKKDLLDREQIVEGKKKIWVYYEKK